MNDIIQKIIELVITLVAAISIIFFAMRLSPGDPVERILGPEAKAEEVIKYREQLGLDKPILSQFGSYFLSVIKLDLGTSLFKKKSVNLLIKEHASPSLTLAVIVIFFSTIIGTTLGVFSALYKGRWIDLGLRLSTLIFLSFPIFSLAPLLIYFFSIKLGLTPVSEWGDLKHIILPALTLIIPLSSILMRVTRTRFLDDLSEPWVQVLKSKGLSLLQIYLRVLKVSAPSVLNVVAIQLSVVLAGTIITETIFDIPGMGLLLFEGIQNRDYPIVQGVASYITIIYLVVYFLIDAVNKKIDPRIV